MHLAVKTFKTSDGKSHGVVCTPPDQVMRYAEPQRSITMLHAHSLIELVKHYRKMVEAMGEDASPLTTAYCDELLEDLND